MYPNIILTNRLQPDAIVNESICATCDFNQGPESQCQRRMEWSWRGEYLPAKKSEYNMIRHQLEQETFPSKYDNEILRSFHDLSLSEQSSAIKKRLSDYSRKVYNKIHENTVIQKESIACQRENPFYINTVRDFRDRRYEYKGLLKVWKKNADQASSEGNSAALDEAKRLITVYDSLQLAHKCILNSFYGYVMRKGARWYSMEMAGIVCLTGSRIIQLARSRVEKIGRPLELDTDGIWCIVPATFPENFSFRLKNGKTFSISYPCVMLNHLVHDQFTNHQYQELQDAESQAYSIRSENSIFFEVDGPYRAMILPSSTEEDKLLKKRYAVFNDDGTLAELKGFEIKRRGELKLIKIFQSEIFKAFLLGSNLEECYASVAIVANRWLDVLYSKGMEHTDEELFDLISENRSMSKSLEDYGAQKSTSISTAKRLAEFLGDQMVKDKGLNCKFIIAQKPYGAPVSERAIPVVIFQAEPSIQKHFLRKWLKDSSFQNPDIREIVDWKYYYERFGSVIQKIITIPAAMQGVKNPVPRIAHPDWLFKRVSALDDKVKQSRITDLFHQKQSVDDDSYGELNSEAGEALDLEDIRVSFSSQISKAENNLDDTVNVNHEKIPDLYSNYTEWLRFKKEKWRSMIKSRQLDKAEYGVDYKRQRKLMGADKNTMAGYLNRQADTILRFPWHILQITETDFPGDFRVWAIIQNNIYSIKLSIPRIFYVNSRIYNPEFENISSAYKVSRVNKTLPRSQLAMYLYEFSMDEAFYIENTGRFAQLFNHENIEGVYELQIPLIYRALTALGSVVKVQRHRSLQQKASDSLFEIDDLERDIKTTEPYISKEFLLNYLFLFHCSSENSARQVFGLFSAPTETLYIFVVDPGQNQEAIPNIKKLYTDKRSEWAPVVTQSTELLGMTDLIDYPEKFDVKVSIYSHEKDALIALNRSFGEYKDQRKGPTIVALQSAHTIRHLSMLGLSISLDFPFLSVPFHQRDNLFPAFGWQSNCIRRMIDHYFNLNDFLKDRLSLARYGDVPLCNIDHDYTVFFSDLFFSRRLKRAEIISWYSPSEKPDLGGRELDDNKHDLDELCIPEINVPGNYPTICIELNVWDLALNTLIQSSVYDEFEGSFGGSVEMKSHLLDHHLKSTEDDYAQKNSVRSFTSASESRISTVTFGIIRNMIRSWSEDIAKHKRIASSLLEHLYRWITSSSSRLFDPAIFSLIHELMKRVYIHLIADLKIFGSKIIYASFHKIVLATSKTEVRNAISYMTYLLHSLRKKEMFTHIDLKPVMFWDHLIWLDMFNYGGVLFENIEGIIGHENIDPANGILDLESTVDFRWNMAEYLPPSCKKHFIKFAAEYVFEIDQFKRKQKKIAMASNVDKGDPEKVVTAFVPSSKILENLSMFTRQLLSTVMKRRLLQVIRQIQRQELSGDELPNELPYEFPVLPGSHLVLKNPALEFVKQITKFFSLDSTVSRESRLLRRDALNLIGIREFSEEANFTNPCETFCLQQVICDFCNHCQDLDLTREDNAEIDENEELDIQRKNCWSCPSCHTLYDKMGIEQKLVNIVRKRLLTWQVQDLKCARCKLVRAEEILGNCVECTGKLNTELDKGLFKRRMKVFENIAEFYEMDLLKEVCGWAVGLI